MTTSKSLTLLLPLLLLILLHRTY